MWQKLLGGSFRFWGNFSQEYDWIKPWSVSHRLTAVTCDHEIITDNTWYKWLYVCFGAFYSHKNCYVIFLKSPPVWVFCLPPYFAHDASCVMLNIDWTPLDRYTYTYLRDVAPLRSPLQHRMSVQTESKVHCHSSLHTDCTLSKCRCPLQIFARKSPHSRTMSRFWAWANE